MNLKYLVEELKVNLLNISLCELGQEWNYSNLISPFSRIYLITDGKGYILPNNEMYQLKQGYLYLIPSYTFCSYHCVDQLSQYYIHFTNQLPDGLKIFDYLPIQYEVRARPNDYLLFERLMELNLGAELDQTDPLIYEKKNWSKTERSYKNASDHLETIGILKQLLARFILNSGTNDLDLFQLSKLRKVFNYINLNIHQEIRMEILAELACCSTDHFTRIFKRVTGMLPLDYINMKRIEKAQILLLTTINPQKEISEQCGFNSLQYYTLMFKRYAGTSPAQYRKMGGLI